MLRALCTASSSTVLCGIQLSQVSYRIVHSGSQNKNKRLNFVDRGRSQVLRSPHPLSRNL